MLGNDWNNKKIDKISNGVKKIFLTSFLIILATSCSSLRGLMEYSAEQDALQRSVAEQEKKAERLFKDIEENKLVTGKTSQQEVMRRYGEPVLVKEIDKREQWLYRTAMEYFSSKKAYLLFDEKGILENVEVTSQNP